MFYRCIYLATEAHCKILKIIVILYSCAHDYTNPVIEQSSIWFFNLFQLFLNYRCDHEDCLFKICIHRKWRLLVFYLVFCICSPILLNIIFHYVICLANTDYIFTLNNDNVEEIFFPSRKVQSNIVSNCCVSLSKQIIFYVENRIPSILTARNYL